MVCLLSQATGSRQMSVCVVALHDGKPEAWRQLLEATNRAAFRFDKFQWQDDRQQAWSLNVDVRNMSFRDLET